MFAKRYQALNDAQAQAVDTIEGPLMVIAGPGTGKTELLSLRVANILRLSDTAPQNILCLTFTESGATAMRQRLAGLIGADAYRVAIHTFHSFGSDIINQYGEYFYHGAHFRPADELTGYETLRAIFEKLPHDNPLSSTMNGDFTYLRDVQSTISDLKKSGLTSDELTAILDRNDRFCTWLQPRLDAALGDRLSKKSIAQATLLVAELEHYEEEPYDLITYDPLHGVITTALQTALQHCEAEGKTKPLSQFKSAYCERDDQGELTLKDVKRSRRLRAVAGIYYDYLIAMQGKSLYDFDDMILRTVHALEVFADLRMNLQEQYQYLLVDEFQDTNDAQMRILWNLTNNPVSGGRPNVCVVGDDDQAIYRFQGANVSNVLGFRDLYRDVAVVTLRDNYRSAEPILGVARATVLHAVERLENTMSGVDKTLSAHHEVVNPQVGLTRYPDEPSEYAELAAKIVTSRQAHPEATIAVITRHHRQLQAMLPYLQRAGLPISYDRRDNVLQSPPVVLLELLAHTITSLAGQRLDEANGLMPELLAHPAWQLEAVELWRLSLSAYTERTYWLDVMLQGEGGRLHDIAQWLLETAHLSLHEPMEYLLDTLSGFPSEQVADDANAEADDNITVPTPAFRSPLYHYFFKLERLRSDAGTYLTYLDALTAIRRKVRDYRPEGEMVLDDFVDCLNRYEQLGLGIQASGHVTQGEAPVELLTAHRSKGLEFDQVYVVGLSDTIWGETARSRGRLISYPSNLAIGIAGDGSDEHVRLLYVALTRAKNDLLMSLHATDPAGKGLLPVAYLAHVSPQDDTSNVPAIERIETAWHGHLMPAKNSDMKEMLRGRLEGYRLSATHLTNYLDVSRGGPERFLLQNLLRFPQAMGPSAAYGSAVHAVLHRAHAHLNATGQRRPIEDLLGDYETQLNDYQLATEVHEHFLKKGVDVLSNYFATRYDSFTAEQLAEQSFTSDVVELGEMRLSGIVDMIDIDNDAKTIVVTDYKTGRPTSGWQGKTDYEKIKLHHYRQQLMFYKLLIENSRRFTGYTVTRGVIEYVEPDSRGVLSRLELDYDESELAEFQQLLGTVWARICSMKFDNVSNYEQTLRGIKLFEADLLSDN